MSETIQNGSTTDIIQTFSEDENLLDDDSKELRCFHENPQDESWSKHEKHFFIVTDSARLVYCRYGNEVTITPILCTIVAFTGQLIRDGNQVLQTIEAGNRHFVFYSPLSFIFVFHQLNYL